MSSEDPFSPSEPTPPPPPPSFSSLPSRDWAADRSLALKILIASGIGLVVGFGTCGLGAAVSSGSFASIGFMLFMASLVGLIVGGVWLLVALIVSASR